MKPGLKLGFILVFLTGCAASSSNYQGYLQGRGIRDFNPTRFSQCRGYACTAISIIEPGRDDWKVIEASFDPKPKTPEQERAAIAKAIGAFEVRVGKLTGTDADRTGTFTETGPYQLDCVDESTNTTIYLAVLEQKGLMKFHELQTPTARTPFSTGRWPHQTAVIREKSGGALYAVDSWFHDNGFAAEIVPIEDWKDGWQPDERHVNFKKVNQN